MKIGLYRWLSVSADMEKVISFIHWSPTWPGPRSVFFWKAMSRLLKTLRLYCGNYSSQPEKLKIHWLGKKTIKTRNLPLRISFSKVSSYIYASINNKATLYQHNFFPPKIQNGSRFLIFSRVKIHSFPKKNNSPLLTAIFVCKTIHYHFLKKMSKWDINHKYAIEILDLVLFQL